MTIKKLIGNEPNQISLNRDLGSLAFQNEAATVQTLNVTGSNSSYNDTLNVANGGAGGITYFGKIGDKEIYRLTQGKYRFAFGTSDFYGTMILEAAGTNYNTGTSEVRYAKWIIPLRYQTSRSLIALNTSGSVTTGSYVNGTLGAYWTNVDSNNGDLVIYNAGSSGPDNGLSIELQFFSNPNMGFSIRNVFSRTSYSTNQYTTTNPY